MSDDKPLDWGTDAEMSAVDTVMWRGDADRRLRSTISVIEVLDCEPDWDRLVAAHDWGTRMAPRFRQRVVESPLRTGTPSWQVDPDFDLHYHLRRVRVAGDGSMAELLRLCEQIAMTPLDPARPPWEGYLIDGLADGKTAYFMKAHHALTDGMGAMLVVAQLHSTTREPQPGKPQPPAPQPTELSGLDVLTRQLGEEINRIPKIAGLAVDGVRALVDPKKALSRVLRYGRSVPRVAGMISPEGSPLLAGRSVSWRFTAFEVNFDAVRAASAATGASVNDVYLGGLIGGFRKYHDAKGVVVESIPVAIPISVRQDGDAASGNRIAVGRLAGPIGIDDPFERVLTIREQVRAARGEPAVEIFNTIGPVLAWLPGQVLTQFSGTTAMNDLQASNVPGIPWDTYFAGAKVLRMYPFGPLPGCAVMATMITHNGIACLGLNIDAAAVTDIDLFADCLVEGFNEVLDLAESGSGDDGASRMTRVI